jgi:hypothetical protein
MIGFLDEREEKREPKNPMIQRSMLLVRWLTADR